MIYFVKAGDRVKIGYSNDPSIRISELQTSCPHDLEVLLIVDGNRDEERELHMRFSDIRRTGEWFKFEAPIKSYIENNIHRDRKYEFGLGSADFESNEQVLRLRQKHRISTTELGRRLNITRQAAHQIEGREKDGSLAIKTLQKVADALGYSFQYRFMPKKTLNHDVDQDDTQHS